MLRGPLLPRTPSSDFIRFPGAIAPLLLAGIHSPFPPRCMLHTVESRAIPYVRILDRFPQRHFSPSTCPPKRTRNVRALLRRIINIAGRNARRSATSRGSFQPILLSQPLRSTCRRHTCSGSTIINTGGSHSAQLLPTPRGIGGISHRFIIGPSSRSFAIG